MMHRRVMSMAHLLCFVTLAVVAICAKPPNIVLIVSDDQDTHMESVEHMPLLKKHMIFEGTTFPRHYCTVTLCCPARVSLLTGKLAHNTNVTDIWAPYGGYPKFISEGHNEKYLPIWLQEAGYSTYYVGKLLNAHDVNNYNNPAAAGWTQSDFLLDPYTYEYMNGHFSRNGEKPVSYKGQYSPDVTADKAYELLNTALERPDQPFFLGIAPIAPHSDLVQVPYSGGAPKYAKRHAHLFKDYKIPRGSNFNPDKVTGVSWVAKLPKLNDTVIEYNDEFQRSRLRALQSVDEMVEGIVKQLEAAGQLDNTYIFYTTDNGYHISQHRMHPGKSCGFDTDINVPMIVRGPGIARGAISQAVTSHTDIAPTIMNLASGAALRTDFDGAPMPLIRSPTSESSSEHVAIEYWGNAGGEGKFGFRGDWGGGGKLNSSVGGYHNNTYKGVRIIGKGYNLYYSTWCTGEYELYDVAKDPGQVHNLLHPDEEVAAQSYTIASRPIEAVIDRLDALIMVLRDCKGDACRRPWNQIHVSSGTDVASLRDSLDPRYDELYRSLPKLHFLRCELGYIQDSEVGRPKVWSQPEVSSHSLQQPLGDKPHWSELV